MDENEKITHFNCNKTKKSHDIPRSLSSYEEVQMMRRNGNKTRLIEINRRLDLYAPRICTSERPDREITELEVFILWTNGEEIRQVKEWYLGMGKHASIYARGRS